ncbi:DNA replication and repair protein RecF [Candidatus Microgenomates bacterium]|nr:DNA replication and repair protein RecF [Candidatus Microgenomates bacterium]
MFIKAITLQHFRSFSKATFSFSPRKTTIIVGPNASGKTNLLEAVYLLATGKSFRVSIEEEMIKTGQELARVTGVVETDDERKTLEVVLTRGEVAGERVGRKKLSINRLAKRLMDYQGTLRIVLFGPWDMGLITDSPSVRRKFLDSVLVQVDREYRRALLSYEKGLRARNKLLERIRDEGAARGQLLFWDRLLIKNGDYLSSKREEFLEFVNNTPALDSEIFHLEYDKSAISEARLAQYADEEVSAATTLVGPHRDDVVFKTDSRNLAVFGSRGEQRMCVLWLKLAELSFVEKTTGEKPILLLDDIFSELDHRHREIVMGVIGKQQTIVTTADPHTIIGLKKDVERIELG